MTRNTLAKYVNQSPVTLSGTVKTKGTYFKNSQLQWILLTDITMESDSFLYEDHLWIQLETTQPHNLNVKKGERIAFKGVVRTYTKKDKDIGSYSGRETDYCVKHIKLITHLSSTKEKEPTTMPINNTNDVKKLLTDINDSAQNYLQTRADLTAFSEIMNNFATKAHENVDDAEERILKQESVHQDAKIADDFFKDLPDEIKAQLLDKLKTLNTK